MDDVNVFVYGTLRTGDCREGAMDGEIVFPEAYITGFEMLDIGSFPGVVPAEIDRKVRGEVHRVSEETLTQVLDRIEGYRKDAPQDGLYDRQIVEVCNPDGECVDAWVYIYNLKGPRRRPPTIVCGDWFVHRGLYEHSLEA